MRGALLAACAALFGCAAAEPVPYHSQNEIPLGPGLFSGPEGAFVLRLHSAAQSPAPSPAQSAAPRDADEEREYREWREWKSRQNQ
jgi:hypothetical protein